MVGRAIAARSPAFGASATTPRLATASVTSGPCSAPAAAAKRAAPRMSSALLALSRTGSLPSAPGFFVTTSSAASLPHNSTITAYEPLILLTEETQGKHNCARGGLVRCVAAVALSKADAKVSHRRAQS